VSLPSPSETNEHESQASVIVLIVANSTPPLFEYNARGVIVSVGAAGPSGGNPSTFWKTYDA
jgi:hypothetical protein